MLHAATAKYALMAMPVFELAVFFCIGIALSIAAAYWLGE